MITVINSLIDLLQPAPTKVLTNSEYWIAFRTLGQTIAHVAQPMPLEGMLASLSALLLVLAIAWVMGATEVQ